MDFSPSDFNCSTFQVRDHEENTYSLWILDLVSEKLGCCLEELFEIFRSSGCRDWILWFSHL